MKKQIQQADLELFREHVQDAEPLKHTDAEPFRSRPAPVPRPRELDLPGKDGQSALSEYEIETQDFLLFARPGVQQRVLADLQRGAIEVGLEVDLHGLTAADAQRILHAVPGRVRLPAHPLRAESSTARVSDPPNSNPCSNEKINYWLRLYDQVLAFSSATRRDGGTGATYVLLRNPNKARRGSK